MHTPQTNSLWLGEEGVTTKSLVYTLPRRVGVRCVWLLMEWVEWMSRSVRVALSLAMVGTTSPGVRPGQAIIAKTEMAMR